MVDESKKTAEEGSCESEQKVDELKKKAGEAGEESQKTTDEKLKKLAEEAVEKQKVIKEVQKQTAKEAKVLKTEIGLYHASSYVLERIFNIKPDDKDSEKNKKGIGSEYHQVSPPFEKKFTFCDDEKVEKAFNMVDQLPENIDITYPKSDDIGDSESVDIEKKKKVEKQKSNKFESKQTWKPKTPKVVPQQIWKQKVDVSEPKQIWKSKNDLSKRNVQSDSRFYQRNVSKGQIWVVKKPSISVSDNNRKINSTKKVENKSDKSFVKNDKDFQKLNNSYCVTIPKVPQMLAECQQGEQMSSLAQEEAVPWK
ncbi:golgin subfamily A member 6-like protein 6 [Helianthus annuus]|uniref:golgin subfamily A member 6-like protein 6 n=1 Tax=Helianthus annuus TaxID=4232 RepID=UPI000B909A85|nr:golgin subfamily A member 6-like protein 6 [Helianthus annuus]